MAIAQPTVDSEERAGPQRGGEYRVKAVGRAGVIAARTAGAYRLGVNPFDPRGGSPPHPGAPQALGAHYAPGQPYQEPQPYHQAQPYQQPQPYHQAQPYQQPQPYHQAQPYQQPPPYQQAQPYQQALSPEELERQEARRLGVTTGQYRVFKNDPDMLARCARAAAAPKPERKPWWWSALSGVAGVGGFGVCWLFGWILLGALPHLAGPLFGLCGGMLGFFAVVGYRAGNYRNIRTDERVALWTKLSLSMRVLFGVGALACLAFGLASPLWLGRM